VKSDVSDLEHVKPKAVMKVANRWYHARGACLLQTVEGTVETVDMVRSCGINKPCGLMAEHHLGETTMKEGIFDIELSNLPTGGEGDGENNPDGSWFNHRAKSLVKVDTVFFREATQDPTCLVAVEGWSREPSSLSLW
jgi:hypothetical protein